MDRSFALCNLLIMISTGLFSCRGFVDPRFVRKFIFRPESILANKEYYRLLSSGFLHANWTHLIFNMMSLYFFGTNIESFVGVGHFLAIYFGSILGGNLLSLLVHRHHDYSAYGASGGVCGVIFASLFLFPGSGVTIFPFPYSVPGWLYAICFMLGSFYGLKAQRDNIGHDAHLGGAICGLLIATALRPSIVRWNPWLFGVVLGLSIVLLLCLVINPLFLPVRTVLPGSIFRRREPRGHLPKYRQDELRTDELLEKIAQEGFDSLTAEERAFLDGVSEKYRRRAEYKKPESGLTF